MVQVGFDYGEVNDLSVGLLGVLEESASSVGQAALATVLTLGRLVSPVPLDEQSETQFMEEVLSFVGTLFEGGKAN